MRIPGRKHQSLKSSSSRISQCWLPAQSRWDLYHADLMSLNEDANLYERSKNTGLCYTQSGGDLCANSVSDHNRRGHEMPQLRLCVLQAQDDAEGRAQDHSRRSIVFG